MSFPSSTDSFTGFTSGETLQAASHAAQSNQEQTAIVALETKVGTGASTPVASTVLRGNGTGTTTYDQVHLTSDVSGVLPTTNGGTGTTSTTGSGSNVFNTNPTLTNPTITTPTLTSPTSTALSNTGGLATDTLAASVVATLASLVLNGSLTGTGLASQVQTYTNTGSAGGTGYYINLGGIKMCWGQTASQSSHNAPAYSIYFPTSFFTTVQSINLTVSSVGTDVTQLVVNGSGLVASGISAYFDSVSNSAGATLTAGWFAIGT